jgi:D-3-phosphoglycerate dehydrogenase
VTRTGVGYDVIDVAAATELGVIVVNIPDIWVREVANHALALGHAVGLDPAGRRAHRYLRIPILPAIST